MTAEPVGRIADWLEIAADGRVVVYTGKVEVGQNVRTSLAQAVADELRLDLEAVRLVLADTGRTPFDAGTFGSRSTPAMAPQLRRAAAAAREALLDLAAERWEANRDDLEVAAGRVRHPETGQSLGFGELTGGRPLTQPVSESVPVTARGDWRLAGRSAPKVGALGLVTGAHRYASDVKRPGMRVGKVLRPPAFGARLRSLDAAAAAALPGVRVVHHAAHATTPELVGVVAPDEATAERALAALRAEWAAPPEPAPPSSRDLFDYLKEHPVREPPPERFRGGVQQASGSVAEGLAGAALTLRARYTGAFIAHAPLEPRAAVAEWDAAGGLTVWTGTQRPFGVRHELSERLGLPEERVRVIVPDTGSGYGGKHYGDAAVEAALLARDAGAAVRVVWTREEEFTWAYFRPAALIEIACGADAAGRLVAWEHHIYNAGAAGSRMPYAVPHQHVEFHVTQTPLRQGSYRALAATANGFARESHLDEVAYRLGLDPLELRRRNVHEARLQAAIEAAAGRFGWERRPRRAAGQRPHGAGYGLAGGTEKGSYVGVCAEVNVDRERGEIRVRRIVVAFDCGAVVNPDHLANQVEGATAQGLGGVLSEAIEFAGGRVLNPRFSLYRVPRFSDVPEIEVVLVDRHDLPSAGGGETPIVGIAPAVANAVFDAAGVRLRDMPLRLPPPEAASGAAPGAGAAAGWSEVTR